MSVEMRSMSGQVATAAVTHSNFVYLKEDQIPNISQKTKEILEEQNLAATSLLRFKSNVIQLQQAYKNLQSANANLQRNIFLSVFIMPFALALLCFAIDKFKYYNAQKLIGQASNFLMLAVCASCLAISPLIGVGIYHDSAKVGYEYSLKTVGQRHEEARRFIEENSSQLRAVIDQLNHETFSSIVQASQLSDEKILSTAPKSKEVLERHAKDMEIAQRELQGLINFYNSSPER